ncbi:hypothetical protein IQ07DRAFT_399785 [Pyrenochaeta sp. DS3sAY3a]|nr:hypothetical protein IQ07DRAFT_399785 [Pyrenochaeta sp. DS3sAY3a]
MSGALEILKPTASLLLVPRKIFHGFVPTSADRWTISGPVYSGASCDTTRRSGLPFAVELGEVSRAQARWGSAGASEVVTTHDMRPCLAIVVRVTSIGDAEDLPSNLKSSRLWMCFNYDQSLAGIFSIVEVAQSGCTRRRSFEWLVDKAGNEPCKGFLANRKRDGAVIVQGVRAVESRQASVIRCVGRNRVQDIKILGSGGLEQPGHSDLAESSSLQWFGTWLMCQLPSWVSSSCSFHELLMGMESGFACVAIACTDRMVDSGDGT